MGFALGLVVLFELGAIPIPFNAGAGPIERAVIAVGIAVALIALARVIGRTPMLSAANVVLGIWLIVMPFVLSYGGGTLGTRATWNDIILGIIVIVFSLASLGLGSARRAR